MLTESFFTFEKGLGGRSPYDYVVMFKILILQKYFNLSDDQVEFQINDRISFMRFLGFSLPMKFLTAKQSGISERNWPIRAAFTEKPAKLAQKDTDARWTKKNNQCYFGYINHIKVDSQSKIITNYEVTDASVHDSQEIVNLIDQKDKDQFLFADSAYTGE